MKAKPKIAKPKHSKSYLEARAALTHAAIVYGIAEEFGPKAAKARRLRELAVAALVYRKAVSVGILPS